MFASDGTIRRDWLDLAPLHDDGTLRRPARSDGVSVVIPTFNRNGQVQSAVMSALSQTLPPREVIVVDDCSTDDTIRNLHSEFGNDRRVIVVHSERQSGACAARNKGIARSTSEWVAFLDSDDSWHPDKLRRQIDLLRSSDAVAAFTGFRSERDGKTVYVQRAKIDPGTRDLVFMNTLGSTSTSVVSRDVLMQVGGFDPRFPSCQDWDLFFRVLARGPGVAVPDPMVTYNDNDHDRISRSYDKVMKGHELIQERILGLCASPTGRAVKGHHRMLRAEMAGRFERSSLALKGGLLALLAYPQGELFVRYWIMARWQGKTAYWRVKDKLRRSFVRPVPMSRPLDVDSGMAVPSEQ